MAESMPMGSQTIKKKQQETTGASATGPTTALGGGAGISFQLLKKGHKGKLETKQLIVPSDNDLAKAASKQDDAAAHERKLIKDRVLQYEAESAEAQFAGGNVYLEQEKLHVNRNRPLSMDVIDSNFGTSGGDLRGSSRPKTSPSGGGGRHGAAGGRGGPPSYGGRGMGRGGRGRGRGNASGRSLV